MRRLGRAAAVLVLPTLALVLALLLAPSRSELALHLYLVVVLAVALATIVGAIRGRFPDQPSLFEQSLERPRREPARLPHLERIEREVALARSSAFDLHYRLRPRLRGIASSLLLTRRGIDLDRQPDAARGILGPDAWELVRPDREPPADRLGPGAAADELERALSAMERI